MLWWVFGEGRVVGYHTSELDEGYFEFGRYGFGLYVVGRLFDGVKWL